MVCPPAFIYGMSNAASLPDTLPHTYWYIERGDGRRKTKTATHKENEIPVVFG